MLASDYYYFKFHCSVKFVCVSLSLSLSKGDCVSCLCNSLERVDPECVCLCVRWLMCVKIDGIYLAPGRDQNKHLSNTHPPTHTHTLINLD